MNLSLKKSNWSSQQSRDSHNCDKVISRLNALVKTLSDWRKKSPMLCCSKYMYVGVQGLSKKENKTHGHGQQCGDCWGGDGYQGTKGEWKK